MNKYRLISTISLALIAFGLSMEIAMNTAIASDFDGRSVKLRVLKDATVNGSRVYLSDVADCKGDANLCREASGIDISGSPAPGRNIFVAQNAITRILEKEWPGAEVSFDSSEPTCRVLGAQAEVRSDEVKQKLQAWINDRVDPSANVKITVSKVVIPYGSGIRPTQTEFEFPDLETVPFTNVDWIAKNLIGVRLTQYRFVNPKDRDDQQMAQGQAHFVVERQMPVAASFISAGSMIEQKDLAMQWVQLRRGANELLLVAESVIGKKTKQAVPSGEPFNMRQIESSLAVNRNQPLTMILRNGDLQVSTKVTAMDSGVRGQIVDVVNNSNKKRMRAKIIDEQTVEAVAF